MKISVLTGRRNYFEDFAPSLVIKHSRGKTVTDIENSMLSHLMMNTSEGHFNEHAMRTSPFGRTVVFGSVTAAIVVGLATQDTAENALAELGMDKVRHPAPVIAGDTVYAFSEVMSVADADQPDAGIIEFKHWGVNQNEKIIFECERRVLVKRRSHWGEK